MTTKAGLGEHISRLVAQKLDTSFVEKAVDARIDQLVAGAVDDALRMYSDTGKLIREAVAKALAVNDLDLPAYGETVTKILKVQIEARVSELVAGRLAADMEELLSLAPKEVKLSDLASEMRKRHEEDGAYGEVITVIVEHNESGSTWLYLDEDTHHSRKDMRLCSHILLVGSDGVISSGTIDRRETKNVTKFGPSYGIGQKLRAFIACGTRIIIDEDDVVTSVGDF